MEFLDKNGTSTAAASPRSPFGPLLFPGLGKKKEKKKKRPTMATN
jgi:hypothetical protein